MGNTRRRGPARIASRLAALLLLVPVACGGALPIGDLLVGPQDFPDQDVTRTGFQTDQSAEGHPTAYAELSASGFTLRQSLVKFDSEGSARAALAGINQQWEQLARANDRITLHQSALTPLQNFDREHTSGVLEEAGGDQETWSLILVEGRVLVRLAISGASGLELLPYLAEKARAKASRQ